VVKFQLSCFTLFFIVLAADTWSKSC